MMDYFLLCIGILGTIFGTLDALKRMMATPEVPGGNLDGSPLNTVATTIFPNVTMTTTASNLQHTLPFNVTAAGSFTAALNVTNVMNATNVLNATTVTNVLNVTNVMNAASVNVTTSSPAVNTTVSSLVNTTLSQVSTTTVNNSIAGHAANVVSGVTKLLMGGGHKKSHTQGTSGFLPLNLTTAAKGGT